MKNITLSIQEDLLRKGRLYAQKQGISFNEMIRMILKKTVDQSNSNFLDNIENRLNELGVDTRTKLNRDEIYER